MTVTESEPPEQPPTIAVGTSEFGCGDCGKLLDLIHYRDEVAEREAIWQACPHCGFEKLPETVEPPLWYDWRYNRDRYHSRIDA